jgi:hypothetical protein
MGHNYITAKELRAKDYPEVFSATYRQKETSYFPKASSAMQLETIFA